MNYICAFLECATIFTISVGLERERKKAGFTRILVCIAFYMLYYVLINQLFDVSVQSSLIGYVIIYLSVKWLYKEGMIHSLVVTVLSAVFAALIEYVIALPSSNFSKYSKQCLVLPVPLKYTPIIRHTLR